MKLTISNEAELSSWLQTKVGRDLVSIKGPPPPGATYSDGELITRPVNVAWRDVATGETFPIEYENT